jgi:hypothetical protein
MITCFHLFRRISIFTEDTIEMLKTPTELTLEIGLISALNIVAVYVAAFVYDLHWSGILAVMVIASLFTAVLSKWIVGHLPSLSNDPNDLLSESVSLLLIALVNSNGVLAVLSYRYNLPMALGISLMSGFATVVARHILA